MNLRNFIMRIIDFISGKSKIQKNPEDDFVVTVTDDYVKVEHPKRKIEQIFWDEIDEIRLINTDTGPFDSDIWLALLGKNCGCLIPHGSNGYDEVYNIISKYEHFHFENVIKSMSSTDNEEFVIWERV